MSLNRAGGDTSSPGVCPCGCTLRSRRYPSDLTDREWMLLEPVLPPALSGPGRRGRPEKHHRRAVLDAIRYVSDNGIKWRALPTDFPPWRTVYGFFAIWSTALVWEMITDRLRPAARLAAGRNPRPSAAVIDSQSVHRCAEGTVARHSSGFDSHKKVNGRKRHIATDTAGFLIAAVVTPANIQDRDAAMPLLTKAARRGARHTFADSGYLGDLAAWTDRYLGMSLEVVKHPDLNTGKGFRVLHRRWVVERTHAWISRRRRCARDYERLPSSHEAWIHIAAHITMLRYIARTTTTHA